MKRKDNLGCDEHVSPEVVDRALKAFWRGSAGPIDRLAGVTEGDAVGPGEVLLLLRRCVGAKYSPSATREDEIS